MKYYCDKCNKIITETILPRCKCGEVYDLQYEYHNHVISSIIYDDKITHWKYVEFMPINHHNTKMVTMGEGGTPLLGFNRLSFGGNLYFKCEFMNPTGSFKDRASALEVTLAQGKDEIICATTGNMGASIAAYAAVIEMDCTIFMPKNIHNIKIEQIKMYGAKIIEVNGDYADALKAAEDYYLNTKDSYLAGDYGIRVEGTKSVGFEICEQFEWGVPDYIIVPVGNGTLLYAIWKAFDDLLRFKIIDKMPEIIGVKSNDPAHTIASAIACKTPLYTDIIQTYDIADIIDVSDEEIMEARNILAKNGLFVEPAGAVAYAGLRKIKIVGDIVVLLTGHGLKGI